jgi:hypothetical protein
MGSETMTCKLRSPGRKVLAGGPALPFKKRSNHNEDVSIRDPPLSSGHCPGEGKGICSTTRRAHDTSFLDECLWKS